MPENRPFYASDFSLEYFLTGDRTTAYSCGHTTRRDSTARACDLTVANWPCPDCLATWFRGGAK